MTTLTWNDRLRIERAVWAFDSLLQDLPRRSRVAKRRELRDNLRAGADDVGAAAAVRQLGDLRQLAAGYLAAEYGDWQPRPSWTSAFAGAVLSYLVLSWLLEAGSSAFRAGVLAGEPRATGSFTWNGIPYLLDDVAFTFSNGASTSVGGAWTPLAYAGVLLVTVLAGRLWRVLPGLAPAPRRRPSEPRAPSAFPSPPPAPVHVHVHWRSHESSPRPQPEPWASDNTSATTSPSRPAVQEPRRCWPWPRRSCRAW